MKKNYFAPAVEVDRVVVEQGIAASPAYGNQNEAGNIMNEDSNYTYTY